MVLVPTSVLGTTSLTETMPMSAISRPMPTTVASFTDRGITWWHTPALGERGTHQRVSHHRPSQASQTQRCHRTAMITVDSPIRADRPMAAPTSMESKKITWLNPGRAAVVAGRMSLRCLRRT